MSTNQEQNKIQIQGFNNTYKWPWKATKVKTRI